MEYDQASVEVWELNITSLYINSWIFHFLLSRFIVFDLFFSFFWVAYLFKLISFLCRTFLIFQVVYYHPKHCHLSQDVIDSNLSPGVHVTSITSQSIFFV